MPEYHSINLYLSPGECSLAPHILLHEVGVPFSTTVVSVKSGLSAEFKRINPKMRVPVLVIDGQTITENPAIMLAISQLVPRKGLMGSTDREKVRVAEWLNWLSGTLHGQAFGGLLRPGRYVDDEGLFDAVREKGWKNVQEGFEMIEMWLGERQGGSGSGERLEQGGPSSGPEERHEGNSSSGPYALGEIFTGVDALLFVFYRWGVGKGFDMQKQYPRYAALFKEVGGREATVKALAAERVAAL